MTSQDLQAVGKGREVGIDSDPSDHWNNIPGSLLCFELHERAILKSLVRTCGGKSKNFIFIFRNLEVFAAQEWVPAKSIDFW